MRIFLGLLLLVLGATPQVALAGEKLSGQVYVSRLKDGDTFAARLDEGRTIAVRLWGIDTPEPSQPWGAEAKDALAALASNPLSIECPNKDRRGRWVCRVRNENGIYINQALVEHGHAWWDKRFAKKAIDLRDAEHDAREQRAGLWQTDNPIAPWDWRRGKR